MRRGLEIAKFAAIRSVDRIILIANDTDLVPARKIRPDFCHSSCNLVNFPNSSTPIWTWHSDFQRDVKGLVIFSVYEMH